MESVTIGAGEAVKILSAGAVRGSLIAAAEAYHAAHGFAFALTFDTAGGVEKRAASEAPDVFASSMDSLRAIAKAGALAGERAQSGPRASRLAYAPANARLTFQRSKLSRRRCVTPQKSRAAIHLAAAQRRSISMAHSRASASWTRSPRKAFCALVAST